MSVVANLRFFENPFPESGRWYAFEIQIKTHISTKTVFKRWYVFEIQKKHTILHTQVSFL